MRWSWGEGDGGGGGAQFFFNDFLLILNYVELIGIILTF